MYVKYNNRIVLYYRYKRCIFQLWHYADEHSIVSRTPTLLKIHNHMKPPLKLPEGAEKCRFFYFFRNFTFGKIDCE